MKRRVENRVSERTNEVNRNFRVRFKLEKVSQKFLVKSVVP